LAELTLRSLIYANFMLRVAHHPTTPENTRNHPETTQKSPLTGRGALCVTQFCATQHVAGT